MTTRESGNRADFLDTVRRAVHTPHGHVTRPIAALPSPVPAVAYTSTPDDDLIGVFDDALTKLGGFVRRIDSVVDLIGLLGEAFVMARPAGDRPLRVVITPEPECAGIAEAVGGRDDVEVLAYDNPHTVATADLGITGARAGVALTGSVIVDASRAGGRTVSLLPPVHLALVRADVIVATPGESWRAMAEPMSSNLVQITGPSRSADIELIITLGVHGPRALLVGVLGEFAEWPAGEP